MFKKVLVANRGEIAIRAFRAAYELGIGTVAVYPVEDRNSVHRTKADESYQIGEPGHPVRAYLSVEAIIDAARAAGADAVYPGYGFLSENPDLAAACARAGITFVGPSAQVLELTGNKARAIAAAKAAGLPVLASSEPSTDIDTLMAAAESMTFPVFVKAVAGGGGRGMRRVGEIAGLRDAIEAAAREAESAFGDATVFLEQAVIEPRHIEVQILADTHGNVIHLFERDCSVQRRHQKVVELAPAPNISAQLRSRLCSDAVAFARQIGYSCAGTVEFLVDKHGNHVFIEMNPRIQVEHTVTEEITDVDLVQAQLRVAAGETLADIGLAQDNIQIRGAALQCRITTEDPANGFRPDTGRITAYRTAEGAGIRLDGGTALGAEVSAYFDSMLVKLTCRGRTFPAAVARAQRAVAEFRIRGVATNLPFLQAVLADPDFRAGHVTTSFIEERPQLLTSHTSGDRGTKILTYLADVTVNKPHGPRPSAVYPNDKLPDIDLSTPPPSGSRQRLLELGPERVRRGVTRPESAGGHRHHVPRRASVIAGHPGADVGVARCRRPRRPTDTAAVVDRGVGRCDLRCGIAVLARGPVGTPRRIAGGRSQHLPADAAAGPQHRRLHRLPGLGGACVRRRGGQHRDRYLPDLRRAQQHRRDAPRDRRGPGHRQRRLPKSRCPTPGTCRTRTKPSTPSTIT